jgi:hypothetical protein
MFGSSPASASFQVNRFTRQKDDVCGIESYYAQSVGPGQYFTTNMTPAPQKVNPLAVENLLMYPRDGFGMNNSEIDADSYMRNQPGFKSNRCMIRAQARPILTVPYMGNGRGNADVETYLLHSEQVRQGKECGTVTEQSFDNVFTPMVPSLKNNIQNPSNLIPEVADPGWMRGGMPSRQYMRDINN